MLHPPTDNISIHSDRLLFSLSHTHNTYVAEGLLQAIDNPNINASMTSLESNTTAPTMSPADRYPNAHKDFYPHGPVCIFKTGPDWPERPSGDWGYPLGREPRPVYNHPITGNWLYIGERIFKHLDFLQVSWSSIDPLAYAYVGEPKPFCPLLVSIGVTPNSISYDDAFAAARDSKGILVGAGFPDIEVAFIESSATRQYSGSFLSSMPTPLPDINALAKPFTLLSGVPLSLLDHPNVVGTGGLFFHLGKDSDGKPIIGLLTCAHVALPPTVYDDEFKRGWDEQSPPIDYIALGEIGYKEAVESINNFIADERASIESWTKDLNHEEALLADEDRDQSGIDPMQKGSELKAMLVNMAQEKIVQAETLHAEVIKNHATPGQRLLGSLLYSAPLSVSPPDRFTSDWAMIKIAPDDNVQSALTGNKVYIGDNLDPQDFRKLLYPFEADKKHFMYPPHGLLQVAGVVDEAEIRRPRTLDKHGEPCMFAIKNGASTGTTVGCVNGIESFLRTFAGSEKITTREIAVVGGKRGAFSDGGDSGAVVVTRDGRIVGLLNGGKPGQLGSTDISYITPYWWLERQIKEQFPDCYLYEGVEKDSESSL